MLTREVRSSDRMIACSPSPVSDFAASRKVPLSGSVAKLIALMASLIIAGLLTGESVTVHHHPWLSWFALIPVFIAIRFLRPMASAACGALWGFSVFAYGAISGGNGIEANVTSAALLTLAPAAFACFGAFATRRRGFDPLILGLGWAAVEFVLNPIRLRYGLIASAQIDNSALLLLGHTGGYIVVAFLVAFICATFLGAVTEAVCAAIPRTLRVIAAGDIGLRLHLSGWVLQADRFLVPSQPRAPPILHG